MNVNLWFARNDENEIIEILKSKNQNTYTCPICASKVIPKALNSKSVTPHFAHIDRDKCSNEAMLHWWFKHKFIERGDTFTIKTDTEYTYTCADFKVEQQFNLSSGIYRPDIIITTTCGEEIVFEMANTNKKKAQDYIDRWMELDKIVVEVDIKSLTGNEKLFNALYYQGKCFNFNKRDGGYYNTIGKLKEKMRQDNTYDIELVRKLDWFWRVICKYETNQYVDIDEIHMIFEMLDSDSFNLIKKALIKRKSYELILIFLQKKMAKMIDTKTSERIKLEEKYLNTNYINKILKENKVHYQVKKVEYSINKHFLHVYENEKLIIKLDFGLKYDSDKYVMNKINNIHNRVAYQQIKNILKETVKELNSSYSNTRFRVDYDKQGFGVEARPTVGRIKEILCHKYYFYDDVYEYRNDFKDKETFKNVLLKK